MQRRDFLQASILSCFVVRLDRLFEIRAQAQSKRTGHSIPDIDIASIKALCFDVIGTVVDWNTSVIKELKQIGASKGFDIDWPKFLNAWRIRYGFAMQRVRQRDLPWMNSDGLRRMALDSLLGEFKITGLNEDEKDQLNKVWHRLKPWQDSVTGLIRLRRKYIIAALSDGSLASLVNMSKAAGLDWDCVLSSELVKHYKPDKEVYLMAVELLGLKPEQIMMVSAHKYDLQAAKSSGMKTAFLIRSTESGQLSTSEQKPDSSLDLIAKDFSDLANKLGA